MLGTLGSNGVTLGIAVGVGLAVAVFLFLGLFLKVPRIVTALAAVVALAAIAMGLWAVLRPTAGVAGPPMVAASPVSTPTVSPIPAGSPSPTSSQSPSTQVCKATGAPVLTEVAENLTYKTPCLSGPAGQLLTITFENMDPGIPHNIHIFSADPSVDPSATSLFVGDLLTGPGTITYQVPALPAGLYFFHCDVHPTLMKGELVLAP